MADDTATSTEDTAADDGTVTLVSPDGRECDARDPVTINNLVYGQGYRLKGNPDPEAAVNAAVPENAKEPETAEHADAATGTQTEVSTPSTARSAPRGSGRPAGTPPATPTT